MPYKVKQTGATLKKLVKESASNRGGDRKVPIYEQTVYFEGDIVEDEDIAPIHVEQYDAGEGNIRELIERVTTKKKSAKQDS